jgi:hypothetical protein
MERRTTGNVWWECRDGIPCWILEDLKATAEYAALLLDQTFALRIRPISISSGAYLRIQGISGSHSISRIVLEHLKILQFLRRWKGAERRRIGHYERFSTEKEILL